MIHRINPKTDFVFHKLFGSDENKDLLISLINSVVGPDLLITDVTIKNPFNLADYPRQKQSILDIKAVDEHGVWYDIEMQIIAHNLYGKRAVYYLCKVFVDQLEAGADYSNLNTAIGIHFLDFKYFDDERVARQFVLKDVETGEGSDKLDCIRLYFVELPKLKKDWPQIQTALDRWVCFLNRAGELTRNTIPSELSREPAITKAITELERIGLDPKEREIYEGEVKLLMVDQIQLRSAREQGFESGRQDHASQMIGRLLTRKLGEMPVSISGRLTGLPTAELDDLIADVLGFTSYLDVESWLDSRRRN
jgi:predicted transposase/invertase (TIGR01784 family)